MALTYTCYYQYQVQEAQSHEYFNSLAARPIVRKSPPNSYLLQTEAREGGLLPSYLYYRPCQKRVFTKMIFEWPCKIMSQIDGHFYSLPFDLSSFLYFFKSFFFFSLICSDLEISSIFCHVPDASWENTQPFHIKIAEKKISEQIPTYQKLFYSLNINGFIFISIFNHKIVISSTGGL